MDEPAYTEFEQGERQALLQVRSFIARHGVKEVSDYCATRLHDMKMDARRRNENLVKLVELASKPVMKRKQAK